MSIKKGFRFALLLLVSVATTAHAESGKYNLHINTAGAFAPIGFSGDVGFDWQFKPGYALDVLIGGWYLSTIEAPREATFLFHSAAGIRFRFLDNKEGYLNQQGGDRLGNLYFVPRLGALVNGFGGAFTFDATLGYEWSVAKPLQLGLFLRPGIALGALDGPTARPYLIAGLGFSFEFSSSPPKDTDRDGLSDEREL